MVNKVILIGNVGADPEVRSLEDGSIVASFSIATDEIYKDSKGERKTTTDWNRVTTRGDRAEFVQKYIKKGMKVYVEGKLHTTSKIDEVTGKRHYNTYVSAKIVKPMNWGSSGVSQNDCDQVEPQ